MIDLDVSLKFADDGRLRQVSLPFDYIAGRALAELQGIVIPCVITESQQFGKFKSSESAEKQTDNNGHDEPNTHILFVTIQCHMEVCQSSISTAYPAKG
jgi:hypothetical protein